jgi:uncharacterized membrane protein YphA (DoxX/SURF4 family)
MNSLANNKATVARISRLTVGALLLLSAFAKAGDSAAFVNLLVQYGFSALAWAAPLITVVEAAAGIGLLLNIYPKQLSLLSMIMILVFSLSFLYAYLFRNVTDCGCFGEIKILKLSPQGTFIRNALLLLLLYVSWRFSDKPAGISRQKQVVAVIAVVCAGFFAGYSFSSGSPKAHRAIHPMYQRAVNETVLPQLTPISPDSTYVIFIFSYRCDGCWNYFENVKRYHDTPIADRMVVFAAGRDSSETFKNYFHPDFEIHETDEKTLTQLTQAVPVMFYISGDTVRHVIQGTIPARYVFEKNYLQIN